MDWAEKSTQRLVLLMLDFEKTFDCINKDILFSTLRTLGFSDLWIRWTSTLYKFVTSSIKVNGEEGEPFHLSRSVQQECPFSTYLFILATDVLGYMLSNLAHDICRFIMPNGKQLKDQSYVDYMALLWKVSLITLIGLTRFSPYLVWQLVQRLNGGNLLQCGHVTTQKIMNGTRMWV
jgi:hypothetical protein